MERLVSELPLTDLWNESGTLTATRVRTMSRHETANLLQSNPVEFAVADTGQPLRWIPAEECYRFWRSEVRAHMSKNEKSEDPATLPEDRYWYVASEWKVSGRDLPVVLLEVTR